MKEKENIPLQQMKEIPGKEVEERHLIVGTRYFIVPRNCEYQYDTRIVSGVFDGVKRNEATVPMLHFSNTHCAQSKLSSGKTSFRYWFPYQPFHRFYEIRRLSQHQTLQIQQVARRHFESRQVASLECITELPRDVIVQIVTFLSI